MTVVTDNSQSQREVFIYSSHLDLLRGLASLTVLIGHVRFMLEDIAREANKGGEAATYIGPLTTGPNSMNPAHQAVVVFFVLSGALVGGSVLRDHDRGLFQWDNYLVKRLSRLLTVLLPALVIGLILDWLSAKMLSHPSLNTGRLANASFSLGWRTFLGNLLFIQDLDTTHIPSFGSNVALWSLSFEFWYYILFPVLVLAFVRDTKSHRLVYAALAVGLSLFLWKDALLSFPVWLMGAAVAMPLPFIPAKLGQPLLITSAVQCFLVSALLWRHPLSSVLASDALLGGSFAILVAAILQLRERRCRTLYDKFTDLMARPSYTLYLFHFPLLTLGCVWLALHFPAFLKWRLPATGLLCCMIYAVCYFFYGLFEAKTPKIRKAVSAIVEQRVGNKRPKILQG